MHNKKHKASYSFNYIISGDYKLNMYIDNNTETSLPDKNQYNSIKSNNQIRWKTVSEFKDKINKFKNGLITSKKDDSNNETDFNWKTKKLNYTNCWDEDLAAYGYARCLRSRCNFISNNIRVIKCHYRDCSGVPRFRDQNLCSTCQNYLSSSEAHAEHVPTCKGFNKYNQKDYKYEKGLRTRKTVPKVPLDRLLSWQDQLINHGSAYCGYKTCSFISVSLAELEEHYVTCCGVSGDRGRSCAHCNFRFSTEEEFAEHRSNCPRYNQQYQTNVEDNYGVLNKMIEKVNENKEKRMKEIVQPMPEFEPGVSRQLRSCTQKHLSAWKLSLSKENCVRCTFKNCNFIAMSLEDMIRHFSYCSPDIDIAKVVCPYCQGRVTSKEVLREHIGRTHWTMVSKGNQKTSNHVDNNGGNMAATGVLSNNLVERLRAWQIQIVKFGFAHCAELDCNFTGKTVEELQLHKQICRKFAGKKWKCPTCGIRIPAHRYAEHRVKCRKVANERREVRSEPYPVERERKDCKTYSRKRKVDLDLTNEEPGNWDRNEGVGAEESQVGRNGWERLNDDVIQVIDIEDEEVERGRTADKSDMGAVEPQAAVVEFEGYESDKSEIEIIEERIENLGINGSREGSGSNTNEVVTIEDEEVEDKQEKKLEEEVEMLQDNEADEVETVDLAEDDSEELENGDEEQETVADTVDIAEEEQEKLGIEDEMVEDEEPKEVERDEREKEMEMVEDEELKEVEMDEREEMEMVEDEELKEVEMDEREKEEMMNDRTVDNEEDIGEQPEIEDGRLENDILDDRGDEEQEGGEQNESEESTKEDDVDSFGLEESEDDEELNRMEIDEGVMSTIFETLDDDFDKCNPPYTVVGNEVEVVERTESSQGTVIPLPNEDSQSFLINEDSGTLDRSEPPSTDSEQVSENEEAGDNDGAQGSGQDESGQGVGETGGANDDEPSDETNEGNSGKESGNGRDGRKKKDDNDDDEDGKKNGNGKKVEKDEDSDNGEEGEEKDGDEDDDNCENKGAEAKETHKKKESVEVEEGSSKSISGEKHEDKESDVNESTSSTKAEKAKEARMTCKSGRVEGSKEIEKDTVNESRRTSRKSKRWNEGCGTEELNVPEELSWGGKGSKDEGESVAKAQSKRGPSKPKNEVGRVSSIESQDGQTPEQVKCAKCEYEGTRKEFDQHNWTEHCGLGWIEGEKEVDLNDEKEVYYLVKKAFKVTNVGVCEKCKGVKRSYKGFAMHVLKCGKPKKKVNVLQMVCPFCLTKIPKYSLQKHVQICNPETSCKPKSKYRQRKSEVERDPDTDADSREASRSQIEAQDEEGKDKTDKNEGKEEDNTVEGSGPQEAVVSSSKRKAALRATSKFQEAFKHNKELIEENEPRKPGYVFYEKGGELPSLCSKLYQLWYSLQRKNKVIPCYHKHCGTTSKDLKEAKLHHFSCSQLPSGGYFCKVCDYYSIDEPDIQSHVESEHRKRKRRSKLASKEDTDMDFGDNEDVDVGENEDEEDVADDEEVAEESETDSDECDSMYERQKKSKKHRGKVDVDEKRAARKRPDSDSEEQTTELAHKLNFCEREKLDNLRGDAFYSKALEMTREFEEGYKENGGESSQEEGDYEGEEDDEAEEEGEEEAEEEEEEEDSEIDHSGVWPELHTESEDWCHVSREVSAIHLPETLESISVSFIKGDKKDLNWRRFKRFEGDITEDVPVMFVGGSVRSMSWCKVSFRRTLEKSVKQYLAVSTAKNIDHLTDVHKSRGEFSWSLVQIWDCGTLENSRAVEPPRFCLGIFQEGGEIWDMLWFPEDTYGKGSNGRLTRIGILATAADDGAVRIWSICDPSQIAFNTKLPLFITEPLVKLIIDTFLEDSCVRLSIGRDGIVAGGYVNGSLAVWNLKNMRSTFCEKIGKCVVIKPHLIIPAHRTSITALTFCPNDNRYITSGGLDRVVKLWDLESPWVPVEQYQRELCLDNIWPKNWPMNIYNFEDVYPNNRKGVIRFVKDVVTSKHSPCLIMDNTCLNLSFSDWLNSICGCNNTGEVKIRFLKNFLRDQDKRHEKNQSTLSSLRLEKMTGADDSDWESAANKGEGRTKTLPKSYGALNAQYGIVIKDHCVKDKGKPLTDEFHPEDFPIRAINKVCFNPNFKSFTHIAVGYNCGLIRIQRLNELQFNSAIRSFSDNAKKPRL